MGRKTFDSIGKVLPNRVNIVITRNTKLQIEGAVVVHSLKEALEKANEFDSEIFIIGGAEIYKESMDLAERIYLTVVDDTKKGDTFFPDYHNFTKLVYSENKITTAGLHYQWLVLEKR